MTNSLEKYIVLEFDKDSRNPHIETAAKAIEKYGGELSIDLERGVWFFEGTKFGGKKIGESRYIERIDNFGVIGVYDKTNINHLNSIVLDWGKIVRKRSSTTIWENEP